MHYYLYEMTWEEKNEKEGRQKTRVIGIKSADNAGDAFGKLCEEIKTKRLLDPEANYNLLSFSKVE